MHSLDFPALHMADKALFWARQQPRKWHAYIGKKLAEEKKDESKILWHLLMRHHLKPHDIITVHCICYVLLSLTAVAAVTMAPHVVTCGAMVTAATAVNVEPW